MYFLILRSLETDEQKSEMPVTDAIEQVKIKLRFGIINSLNILLQCNKLLF